VNLSLPVVKNLHIPHIEELLFMDNGPKQVSIYMDKILDRILTNTVKPNGINLFYKWDGSMSLFFGINNKGQFFVANKSLLNIKADKKMCYGYADILYNYGSNLSIVNKLNHAFQYLEPLSKQMLNGAVVHADILFTEDSLIHTDKTNEYEELLSFCQPNVVSYYFLTDTVKTAKFGIAIHGCYNIDINSSITRSSKVIFCNKFLNHSNVYVEYPTSVVFDNHRYYKDVIGKEFLQQTKSLQHTFVNNFTQYENDTYFKKDFWKVYNQAVERSNWEFATLNESVNYVVNYINLFQEWKETIINLEFFTTFDYANINEGFVMKDQELNTSYKIVNRLNFSARNFRKWAK
jgi:hypothetical protein